MDMRSGAWLHFPHGNKSLHELDDTDEVVLRACEAAWYTVYVYSKPPERRTISDMNFIAWVNKKDG